MDFRWFEKEPARSNAYGKLATNYLAFIKLAPIRLWLRANESTP
jgi:hypothetical protein